MPTAYNIIQNELKLHFANISRGFQHKWSITDPRLRDIAGFYIKKFVSLAYPDPIDYFIPSITMSALMKTAPTCITGLLYRLRNGTINTHLKCKERLALSRIARAVGIEYSELKSECLKNINRAYPNDSAKQVKGVLTDLAFGYKANMLPKMPSCEALIRTGMCGKIKQAQRNNIFPQQVCCNELRLRSSCNATILYTPMFYVNQMKRISKRKIEYDVTENE